MQYSGHLGQLCNERMDWIAIAQIRSYHGSIVPQDFQRHRLRSVRKGTELELYSGLFKANLKGMGKRSALLIDYATVTGDDQIPVTEVEK